MTAEASFRVVRDSAERITVQVAGELDLVSEDRLLSVVHDAIDGRSTQQVVLDLAAVEFIDSSGLRAVLRGQQLVCGTGAKFALIVGDGPVARLFALAGVEDRFDYV